MWRRGSRKNAVLSEPDLLASLILNDDFWVYGNFQSDTIKSSIPVYIKTLQSIARHFKLFDLYENPETSRKFLQACIDASGPELIQFETTADLRAVYEPIKANPLAKKLYRALQAAGKGDYQALDKLIAEYKKFLIWNFMRIGHLLPTKKEIIGGDVHFTLINIDELIKSWNAFKKQRASSKPEFLILYEFFIQTGIDYEMRAYKTKYEDWMKSGKKERELAWYGLCNKFISSIKSYFVVDLLTKNPSLYSEYFNNPRDLAFCLRPDSYGICFYDKDGKSEIKQDYETIYFINDILQLAFINNFEKIFKSAHDIYKFLKILEQSRTDFSTGSQDSAGLNKIIKAIESHIKNNKKALKMIGDSKLATEIYQILPGIEKHCKAAVAYSHAGYGLMGAKKLKEKGEGEPHPVAQLPRDVVKIIAEKTDQAMKQDLEDSEKKGRVNTKHKKS